MPRRVTRHQHQAPLPQRNGIDPVHLILPDPLPEEYASDTIAGFLIKRFYPTSPETIYQRYQRQEIKQDDGSPLPLDAPYQPGKGIWYYRELPHEEPLSDDIPVLYEDEHLLAVDKPHFLPTTPRGSYVAQTLLTKLRVRENNPLLIPIHRLDRPTAGILLLAKTREARGPFQTMFQKRSVNKSYLAVAPALPDLPPGHTREVQGRIDKERDQLQVTFTPQQEAQAAGLTSNSHSTITCLSHWKNTQPAPKHPANPQLRFPAPHEELALYQLIPHTGKTHQLRAHLNHLGAPIYGDVQYPSILDIAPDTPELPLQLLAHTLNFTHPITRTPINLTSTRQLALTQPKDAA